MISKMVCVFTEIPIKDPFASLKFERFAIELQGFAVLDINSLIHCMA